MRTRERLTAISVTVAIAGSLAMLGSAPRWATCAALFLAIASALPQVWSRRVGAYRSPMLWLLAAASGLTALQLVPLPAALVELLAPARYALEVDNAAALGVAPGSLLPLTYDAPATWVELAKLVGYGALAGACLGLASAASGRAWLARTVAGAGVAMALCALAHHALGLRVLFTVYQPEAQASSFLAPLLNDNHLAGFLAVTTPLALAVAMTSRKVWRALWFIGALACAAVALLVESRGAAVALVVGLVFYAVLSWREKQLEESGRRHNRARVELSKVIPAGIVVACVVVLMATFAASGVRDELALTSTAELKAGDTKVGVWRASAELAGDNSWTGVGRGAFEFAFTRVNLSGLKTYSHVENEYLQALVDWGLPATAVLALLGLWLALAALRNWRRSPLDIGALAALCALALSSAFDFAVELPGVAFTAIAVAAIPLGEKLDRARRERIRWLRAGRIALIAAALAAVGVASSPIAESARAEALAVSGLMADTEVADERVIQAGKRAFMRHPSDYLSAAQLAQAYFYRARDPRALALMNRALSLNPNHAGLHVFTAKLLRAGARPEQALIEFSLALRYTLEPNAVLTELLRAFPEPELAARGIPLARKRVPVMVNRLSTLGRSDVALAYVLRAVEEMPDDLDIANLAAELALAQGDSDTALTQAERAYRERGWPNDALWYGRILMRVERQSEAVEITRTAIGAGEAQGLDVDIALYELHATALLVTGEPDKAGQVVRTTIDLAVGDRRALRRLYTLLARIEQALGHPLEAQEARKRAHDLSRQ